MPMMPPGLLIGWLTGLVSLALLGAGGYLVWAWCEGVVVGTGYLAGGIVMLLWSAVGRMALLHLLRRPGPDEPREARSDASRRISRPDRTEIHVEFYGPEDASTLVLTHGCGVFSTAWYYAKRLLAGRYRLVVWDLPGVGLSRGPRNRDYSMEKQAGDLRAVIDLAGERPVILVGHSMGGMITETFCRLFPEYLGARVSGIMLLDTTYLNPVRTAIWRGFFTAIQKPVFEPLCHLSAWLWPLSWASNALNYVNGMAHLQAWFTGFSGQETRGQLDFAARYAALCSPEPVSRGMLAMLRANETDTLASLPVPVLVVCGYRDRMTELDASVFMSDTAPHGRLRILEPGGHMSLLENPRGFADAVESLVAQTTAEPALRRAA